MNDSECKSKSNKDIVALSNKHIGWLVSFVIILLFFSFITGYFLGQKKAVEQFSGKIEHGAFGDQVYSSMCGLYDSNDDVENHGGESESTNGQAEEIAEKSDNNSKDEPIAQKHEEIPKKAYYAQLIGFGNENNAKKFANRVQQKDISVSVLKRMSKTARGKVVPWYQVITEDFNDKEKLEITVARLKKEEKLHDVRIVIR